MGVLEAHRRFFCRQAKQEAFHARVFDAAVRWLQPKGVSAAPGAHAMQAYANLLDSALARGDAAECLMGNQIVLEALGEVELEKLDAGIGRRRLGFRRLRATILRQEQAHHQVGEAALEAILEVDPARRMVLRRRADDYLALVDEMFEDAEPLFGYFNQDVATHRRRFHELLPGWLRDGRLMPA